MSGIVVASLAACGLSALAAGAAATPPTREQVRAMLSGYEDVPDEAHWRAIGPEALPVLIAVYADPSEPPFVRLRCVAAVSSFPSPATRTFLLGVARAPRQSDLFVREAVLALGRAFGARAVGDLRPFLESDHIAVREGAAMALGRTGTGAAEGALRRRLATEPNAHVRAVLEREVARSVRR